MSDVNTYDKAVDLAESVSIENIKWSAWELDFIDSFSEAVLNGDGITFTKKQVEKIDELWDKI